MKRTAGSESGRRLCVLAFALVLACFFSCAASAEEGASDTGMPRTMLYDGFITDENGQPLPDGSYDLRFSLYDLPSGGSALWTEEHLAVEIVGGAVHVSLGEGTTPCPLELPFDRQYYLGIQLGDDPEMVPRLRLLTSAYAFRAREAEQVPDASITSEKLAPSCVTDEHIANVSWEKITDVPENRGGGQRGDGGALPANVWHTKGNVRTDPEEDYVGTGDETDLILATDGVGRLTIAGDGSNITIDADTLVARYMLSRVSSDEGALFLGDTNHGIKRVGNDDVHLYTTGGNLLLEGGNVGIGTPTPTATLHVVSTTDGADSDITNYPVLLETPGQGMAIKVVGDSDVDAENNYMSFWDDSTMRGRIEGQDAIDVLSSWQYWYFSYLDWVEVAVAASELAGAISDFRFCGITACGPGAGPIASAAFDVASRAAQVVATQVLIWDNLGVSYESSSGDYAEWLERLDPGEVLAPGDIVGVFGGKVTRSTEGAQHLMVVSSAPIILGNMPPEGEADRYAKIAFLGQVPVKVVGPVQEGDYIIPSGLGDGVGVAVPEHLMTPMEYAKVVGRAWDSSLGTGPAMVVAAVGLSESDVANALSRQQTALDALVVKLAESAEDVEDLQTEMVGLRDQVGSLNALCQEIVKLGPQPSESSSLDTAGASQAEEPRASGEDGVRGAF